MTGLSTLILAVSLPLDFHAEVSFFIWPSLGERHSFLICSIYWTGMEIAHSIALALAKSCMGRRKSHISIGPIRPAG